MNLLHKLTEKPWLAQPEGAELALAEDTSLRFPARTALKFFIAIVSVLFFLFSITFLSRSQFPNFQALAGEPWLPLSHPSQLWFNSGLLLLASVGLELAKRQAARQRVNGLVLALGFAVICSIGFVIGQYLVWLQLSGMGFTISANPANSYFYLLTAVHALHLLGGLLALARLIYLFGERPNLASLQQNLSLCALYWHYLLLLWLFLFTLLAAPADAYRAIAAFCGL
ncbi:cytochrome c oxidase subunit 3 [Shewanella salipaludis]|uniref:Cytochrome c oxidase subunit III n=1 Tax=Shewanella salipaludis TaxID=2723052 RepID=A0A972FPW9_9GAMM|nr:cytochrome c oxidase subunit 3 [Shewanella salipaludis]NMH63955.1 cytochrome c oxidase subunit III [Shewanella salipaludis]